MPDSVLEPTIAPIMSCILSALRVTSPLDTVKSVPSKVATPALVSVANSADKVAVLPSPCVCDTSSPSPTAISNK